MTVPAGEKKPSDASIEGHAGPDPSSTGERPGPEFADRAVVLGTTAGSAWWIARGSWSFLIEAIAGAILLVAFLQSWTTLVWLKAPYSSATGMEIARLSAERNPLLPAQDPCNSAVRPDWSLMAVPLVATMFIAWGIRRVFRPAAAHWIDQLLMLALAAGMIAFMLHRRAEAYGNSGFLQFLVDCRLRQLRAWHGYAIPASEVGNPWLRTENGFWMALGAMALGGTSLLVRRWKSLVESRGKQDGARPSQ